MNYIVIFILLIISYSLLTKFFEMNKIETRIETFGTIYGRNYTPKFLAKLYSGDWFYRLTTINWWEFLFVLIFENKLPVSNFIKVKAVAKNNEVTGTVIYNGNEFKITNATHKVLTAKKGRDTIEIYLNNLWKDNQNKVEKKLKAQIILNFNKSLVSKNQNNLNTLSFKVKNNRMPYNDDNFSLILFGNDNITRSNCSKKLRNYYNIPLYNSIKYQWQFANKLIEPIYDSTSFYDVKHLYFSVSRMFLTPTGNGFIYSSFSKPQKIKITDGNKTATKIKVKSLASDIIRNGMSIKDFNFDYWGILLVYFKPASEVRNYNIPKNNKITTNVSLNNDNFNTTLNTNPNSIEITKNQALIPKKYDAFKIEKESGFKTKKADNLNLPTTINIKSILETINSDLNPIDSFVKKENMDFPYNDIIQGPYSPEDCAKLAMDNNSAKGFATNSAGTYCWIKNKLENYNPNRPGVNMYIKKSQMPLNVYKKYNGQDCAIGDDLMFKRPISLENCKTLCNSKKDCTGISYQNNMCYLKNKPCTNPRWSSWTFYGKDEIK